MAVSPGVTLQSVLGTLTGRTDVTTITDVNATITGTISVVGEDVLIYSPQTTPPLTSAAIPFNAIDHVNVP